MNPFHPAWRASTDVRPRLDAFTLSLALAFTAALGTAGCSSSSDEPTPVTHHDAVRSADTTTDAPDAEAHEEQSTPAPPPTYDWGTAGGSGGGGAAPAGSGKANQPRRVQ